VSIDLSSVPENAQGSNVFYGSPMGLQRNAGSSTVAWTRVVNALQATGEWKIKHGRCVSRSP